MFLKFRRFFAVLLTLCLLTGLSGCGSSKERKAKKLAALSDEELITYLLSEENSRSKFSALDAEFGFKVKVNVNNEEEQVSIKGSIAVTKRAAAMELSWEAEDTGTLNLVYRDGTVYCSTGVKDVRFPFGEEELKKIASDAELLPSTEDSETPPEPSEDSGFESLAPEKIFRKVTLTRNDDGGYTVTGEHLSTEGREFLTKLCRLALGIEAEETQIPDHWNTYSPPAVSFPKMKMSFEFSASGELIAFSGTPAINITVQDTIVTISLSMNFRIRSTDARQIRIGLPEDAEQYQEIPNPLISGWMDGELI